MGEQPRFSFIYTKPDPDRLDKVLMEFLSTHRDASRSQLKRWIEEGFVSVNERSCTRPGSLVKTGSVIALSVPPARVSRIEPEFMALDVIFEDDDLLVINKPANLAVHPGAGPERSTLVNGLAAHFRSEGMKVYPERMGIVHRLDKDTTGVLVVCKNERSHRAVALQFAKRTVKKIYTALVFLTPRSRHPVAREDSGIVDAPIGRHPSRRVKMAAAVPDPDWKGRQSVTKWRVEERFSHGALLSIELLTGRTHQIRAHLEYIKSPIVGDMLYGNFAGLPPELARKAAAFGRQALHASTLQLLHPSSGKFLSWHAPLPEDFKALVNHFRKK